LDGLEVLLKFGDQMFDVICLRALLLTLCTGFQLLQSLPNSINLTLQRCPLLGGPLIAITQRVIKWQTEILPHIKQDIPLIRHSLLDAGYANRGTGLAILQLCFESADLALEGL
jgi:hypothetical protein